MAFRPPRDADPVFEEGLYLSSPEFWDRLQEGHQLKGREKDRVALAFTKYWLRSCTRCTPYGTFAGAAMARISGKDTNMVLAPAESHLRHLRLDMNYIAEVVASLMQRPDIRDQILFIPNNSLYTAAGSFRYAEYQVRDAVRRYQLTSVDCSPYLQQIFAFAGRGATLNELTNMLMRVAAVEADEALEYLNELWRSQLLIPLIEPPVTGPEPLVHLITQLDKMSGTDEIAAGLKAIRNLLGSAENGAAFYRKIEALLEQLNPGIKIPKNAIQADLFLNTFQADINEELIVEIVRQAEDLKALARPVRNADLEAFKTKFYVRYEDAEIPLHIALDADMGIGYAGIRDQAAGGGLWIDDLPLAAGGGINGARVDDYLQQLSVRSYQDWIVQDKPQIEIPEKEMSALKKHMKHYRFPASMFLMGNLMKRNGKLDREHFIFDVSAFGGPSAANLLGRFTHGDDRLWQLTRQILEREEQEYPDAIYAEVVHLPQARTGNVLLRPLLRKYEIPYVGLSGMDHDSQISVDDLYVSIRNDEVILRSRKWNRRVFPRLTTAHNYGFNSLPVYKFLCDLQTQGLAWPNVWDWGQLAALKHLPRVVYKNLVLQKAAWKIKEQDLAGLPEGLKERSAFFEDYCRQQKMPRRVVYKEGDNELLIDFAEDKGQQLLQHYLKRYKNIRVEEFLFTEDNCIVHDAQQNPFTNELVIPLYDDVKTEAGAGPPEAAMAHPIPADIKRSFTPYSEWLYFKVYCGAKSGDRLLVEVLLPFVERGLEAALFEKFFFIRYHDEAGGHLRIRFYNSACEKQPEVYHGFMQCLQPLFDNGMVHKIALDTYNRELNRYLPALIDEAETIFFHDSLAVLRFINLLDEVDGDQYRMLFALRSTDQLLSDFGFTIEEKCKLIKTVQTSFFKEFGAHTALREQLNDRYRKHRQFFVSHLDPERDGEHEIEEAAKVFNIRTEMNNSAIGKIASYLTGAGQKGKLPDLLTSYIHMSMNRLFVAQQRTYELVAYHFLERYYTSQMAITKQIDSPAKVK